MDPWITPAFLVAGVTVGLLTALVGFRQWWEAGLWAVLHLIVAGLARVQSAEDAACFVALAALAGVVAGIVQTLLLVRYRANNPWYSWEIPEKRSSVLKLFAGASALRSGFFGVIFAAVSAAMAGV